MSEDNSWMRFRSEKKGGTDKRRVVYCIICAAHEDIVRIHCGSSRFPAICTPNGAVFRKALVNDHRLSQCHLACMARARQEKAVTECRFSDAEGKLEKSFRFANSLLEKKIQQVLNSCV